MRITIINGIGNEDYKEYELAMEKVRGKLSKDHIVDLFKVRDMKINYCCGCFGCWIKTPGLCVFKDDMDQILRSMANSNYIIYVSPLNAGFITSQAKKVMDRFIPNALPYINIYDGECHHPKRYEAPQNLGLMILDDGRLDKEAVEITSGIFERFSLNMHANKFFKAVVKADEMEVLLNEVSNC